VSSFHHDLSRTVFLSHLYIKRTFYQDRLGTNLGTQHSKTDLVERLVERHIASWDRIEALELELHVDRACKQKHASSLFSTFSYVCPEPVLVK
jgi:hypothetical protein